MISKVDIKEGLEVEHPGGGCSGKITKVDGGFVEIITDEGREFAWTFEYFKNTFLYKH